MQMYDQSGTAKKGKGPATIRATVGKSMCQVLVREHRSLVSAPNACGFPDTWKTQQGSPFSQCLPVS